MTLQRLATRMFALGKRFENKHDRNIRQIALVADQRLANATPVDTGKARSNWLAGINVPNRFIVSAGTPNLNKIVIGAFKAGSIIYISNNVPYIGKLNAGGSRQAPAGFIEHAVIQATITARGLRYLDGN